MARLNEPVVPTDSIETLRRRFLRQNRDIARSNQTQSLKIRSLDNECARMLSENLELRGQILRLEAELRESRAQRIADHALEIREKMEAQLVEWGAMLASLGHEPIPKSRSPRATKKAKRSSLGRIGMTQWRRRETMGSMQDLEDAAAQEGRLPPLWEEKTYPRETLTRDELVALRSVVDDNADSPDLGPPPVSRFVDDDPVKIDLPVRPTKPTEPVSTRSPLRNSTSELESKPTLPSPTTKVEAFVKREPTKQESVTVEVEEPKPSGKDTTAGPARSTNQDAKPNLKRKSREDDEKENAPVSHAAVPKGTPEKSKSKNAAARPLARPVKDLTSNRKETKDKPLGSAQRRPLGVKNSNETLNSPKKKAKPPGPSDGAKAKADPKRVEPAMERAKPKKDVSPVEIQVPPPPPPEPITVATVEIPDSPSAEPNLAVPDSPALSLSAHGEDIQDTPPPADISSRGETARGNGGSRRARTAVSYAEPNLRDKMRRPTKQLFDAVSGEGKHMRRASHSRRDEPPQAPSSASSASSSSAVKSEGRPGPSSSSRTDPALLRRPNAGSAAALDGPPNPADDGGCGDMAASPLAQKTIRVAHHQPPPPPAAAAAAAALPTSVVMDRKKRHSTATSSFPPAQGPTEEKQEAAAAAPDDDSPSTTTTTTRTMRPAAKAGRSRLEELAAREAEVAAQMSDASDDNHDDNDDDHHRHHDAGEADVYEFNSSPAPPPGRSADGTGDGDGGAKANNHPTTKPGRGRPRSKKRASMAVPKTTTAAAEGDGAPGTAVDADAGGPATRDDSNNNNNNRVSARRRSMML
ncbi:hypothetical protein GGR56DRAFT_690226 [Xylariaceae sp. FL0804]|nr:hypothetical protein GGR56DRAFT_690226 [Xylariaceae sp. FL0804]